MSEHLSKIMKNPNFQVSGIFTKMVKGYLDNNRIEALSLPGMFRDVFLYYLNDLQPYQFMHDVLIALPNIEDAIFVCKNTNIDNMGILHKFPGLIHSVVELDLVKNRKYLIRDEREALLKEQFTHKEALYILNKFALSRSEILRVSDQLDYALLHRDSQYDIDSILRTDMESVQTYFEKLIGTASNRLEILSVSDFIKKRDLYNLYSRTRRVITKYPLYINDKVCRCGFAHHSMKPFKVHRYACPKKHLPLIEDLLNKKMYQLKDVLPLSPDANPTATITPVALDSLSDANVVSTQSNVEQQTTQTTTL